MDLQIPKRIILQQKSLKATFFRLATTKARSYFFLTCCCFASFHKISRKTRSSLLLLLLQSLTRIFFSLSCDFLGKQKKWTTMVRLISLPYNHILNFQFVFTIAILRRLLEIIYLRVEKTIVESTGKIITRCALLRAKRLKIS